MKQIAEYLLSKKQSEAICRPSKDIGEICRWIEENGVTEHHKYSSGGWGAPEKGKLYYEIGYCNSSPGTHWVALNGNPDGNFQSCVARTKIESAFNCKKGNFQISFEKALDIMLQMMTDPNKVIEL